MFTGTVATISSLSPFWMYILMVPVVPSPSPRSATAIWNASWKSRTGREIGDVDGGIVLTQMMYQAEELGIGSLIVGIYKEPLLRERFCIPENLEIVALLVMGYAAEDCEPHPEFHASRKPLEETVFYGSFENLPQMSEEREAH